MLALIILFQPEIRRILEQLGSKNIRLLRAFAPEKRAAGAGAGHRPDGAWPAREMSQHPDRRADRVRAEDPAGRRGAQPAPRWTAAVSSELLKNIFFVKAPMHDGAVIIRHGRILGAGCMLPLSKNVNLSRDLGMRHRAGIGMSENSDAVVVIVSEETGSISVAIGGMLKRHLHAGDAVQAAAQRADAPARRNRIGRRFAAAGTASDRGERGTQNDEEE